MVCFSAVRFGVWLTFRALALRRSSLRDCGEKDPGVADGAAHLTLEGGRGDFEINPAAPCGKKKSCSISSTSCTAFRLVKMPALLIGAEEIFLY